MHTQTPKKTRDKRKPAPKQALRLSWPVFLLSLGLAFLTVGVSAALASLTISGTSITGDSSFTDITANSGNLSAASVVVGTSTLPSGTKLYTYASSTSTGVTIGIQGFAIGNATSSTNGIEGGVFEADTAAGNTIGNITSLIGVYGIGKHNATSTATNSIGGLFQPYNTSSGSILNAIGVNTQIFQQGSGVIVNALGFVSTAPSVTAGSITNYYGFYQPASTAATNNYGAYFANKVGIGTATPLQMLNVGGAPTQSSTSSLVLLGSSNLSGGNASGTFLGINAASGYGGDFVNFQTNSTQEFAISSAGEPKLKNNTWVKALNAAGSGYVDLLSLNSSNEAAIGAPVSIVISTSTIQLGDASHAGCLELGSASGTPAKIVYVYFDTAAVMYSTTTKPSFCQ